MESISIDILNPKAKALLKNLANLKLIRIRREKQEKPFSELLQTFRSKSEKDPSLEEITAEVEAVRKARHDK